MLAVNGAGRAPDTEEFSACRFAVSPDRVEPSVIRAIDRLLPPAAGIC